MRRSDDFFRKKLIFLTVVICACIILGADAPVSAASRISFSPERKLMFMKVGSAKTMKVVLGEKRISSDDLIWKSSNTKVAYINNGKILAVKNGTAKITAVLKKDFMTSVSCMVYVYKADKSISFNKKNGKLINIGSSFTLKPSKTNVAFIWKSSDPKIASVSNKGKVKALKPGKVTIAYYGADGSKWRYVARIKLQIGYAVQSVITDVSNDTLFLQEGERSSGHFSVLPKNATIQKLAFKSANSSIASVDADGSIQAVNPGSTFITAKACDGSGKKAVMYVRVLNSQSTKKVFFTAHRGASAFAPENTLPAFELAGMSGADAVECDVYVTKDGKFVIHHDKNITRMCGIDLSDGEDPSKYDIQNMTLEELQSFSIKSGMNIDKYHNLKIPTLKEYLGVCNKYQVTPVVELKGRYTEKNISDLKRELSISQKVPVVISFHYKLLLPFSNRTGFRVQYICSGYNDNLLNMCKKYNWGIDIDYSGFTDDQIKEFIENGIEVQLWLIDDFAILNRYVSMGIREFTTNSLFMYR